MKENNWQTQFVFIVCLFSAIILTEKNKSDTQIQSNGGHEIHMFYNFRI
jgi:hypothetical protein